MSTSTRCSSPGCSSEIPPYARNCPVCDADVGYPNVRAASADPERQALARRVRLVESRSKLRGATAVVIAFRKKMNTSVAVLSRTLGVMSQLVQSDNDLYSTYYQAVAGQARLPQDNAADQARQAADSIMFPYYYDKIRFASLSLTGEGLPFYGEYAATLRESAIAKRSTVFEENSLRFVQAKRIVPGDPIPLGHRAPWSKRSDLAIAKLGDALVPGDGVAEFQAKLLNSQGDDPNFIEVHIFGPFNRQAIQAMRGPTAKRRADRALVQALRAKLLEINVVLQPE